MNLGTKIRGKGPGGSNLFDHPWDCSPVANDQRLCRTEFVLIWNAVEIEAQRCIQLGY